MTLDRNDLSNIVSKRDDRGLWHVVVTRDTANHGSFQGYGSDADFQAAYDEAFEDLRSALIGAGFDV